VERKRLFEGAQAIIMEPSDEVATPVQEAGEPAGSLLTQVSPPSLEV